MNQPAPTAEMVFFEPKGKIVAVTLATAFVLFFVLLAFHNLVHWIAVIPSALWLLLVGSVMFGLIRHKGIKAVAVDFLEGFSLKQFIQAVPGNNGPNRVEFGYELFGRRFVQWFVGTDKIEHVSWSTGQASDRMGRDMDDWHVAVWHDHGDPARSERLRQWRYADQEVHCLGPSGRKADVAVFGLALVEFLRKAGATLVAGENDCIFERPPVGRQTEGG